MIEYMPYIWAAITLIAIVLESATADLVTIWFIPAGALAFVLSILPAGIPVWVQVLTFFVCAAILLVLSKTFFKELFKKKPIVATNLDSVIGQDGVVVEKIDNLANTGAVKAGGKVWSAISSDNSVTIEVNELVTVLEIRGVKLVCSKKQ